MPGTGWQLRGTLTTVSRSDWPAGWSGASSSLPPPAGAGGQQQEGEASQGWAGGRHGNLPESLDDPIGWFRSMVARRQRMSTGIGGGGETTECSAGAAGAAAGVVAAAGPAGAAGVVVPVVVVSVAGGDLVVARRVGRLGGGGVARIGVGGRLVG